MIWAMLAGVNVLLAGFATYPFIHWGLATFAATYAITEAIYESHT